MLLCRVGPLWGNLGRPPTLREYRHAVRCCPVVPAVASVCASTGFVPVAGAPDDCSLQETGFPSGEGKV